MFAYFMGSVVVLCLGIQYIVLNKLEKLQADYNSLTIHDAKDGAWTQWGSWDSCSATCGGGIKSRTRTCSDPTPSPLGRFCDGEPIQYGPCSQNTCPYKVAFHAYTEESGHFPPGKVVIYPHVLLNDGEGYQPSTGFFTAPVSGVYHFTAHICNGYAKYLGAGCESVSAIAKVQKNEHVYVVARYSDSHMFSTEYRRPSFMGYLLYEKA